MDDVNDALELNRLGASLLSTGNRPRALHAFRAALNILKRTTRLDGTTDDEHHKPGAIREPNPVGNDHAQPYSTNCQSPDLDDNQFYIFDRALDVVPAGEIGDCIRICSAAILFNMALCMHGKGKADNDDRGSTSLDRAISLYRLCSLILESSPHPSTTMLQIILKNNMGLIQYEQYQYAEARQTVEEVSVAMKSIDGYCPFLLQAKDVDGLLLNVMMLQHSPTGAKAA